MTGFRGFPPRAIKNIIEGRVIKANAVELCVALAKEVENTRNLLFKKEDVDALKGRFDHHTQLYHAAKAFADCYDIGTHGPGQLPPGVEANAKLAKLREVLDNFTGRK
jgi:hypothetical protein